MLLVKLHIERRMDAKTQPLPDNCRAHLARPPYHKQHNEQQPPQPALPQHQPATAPLRPSDSKRKWCQVCHSKNDRKTNALCFSCKKIYLQRTHYKRYFFQHMHLNTHIYIHVLAHDTFFLKAFFWK